MQRLEQLDQLASHQRLEQQELRQQVLESSLWCLWCWLSTNRQVLQQGLLALEFQQQLQVQELLLFYRKQPE